MEARARRTSLLAAAIGIVVAFAYLPTLRAGLVWDDTSYVLAQGGKHVAGALVGDLIAGSNPAHGPVGYYRPVPVATFWLGARLSPGAVAHHALGIAFHALAAALLFALLAGRLGKGGEAPAALGSLAWALHPANVEPVAWVSGRYDLLAGLLAVAFLALPWRPGARRAVGYGLLFLAGLLSKEGFLALAPVVIVDDLASRRSAREALPRWVAVGTAVAAWAGLRALLGIAAMAPAPLASLPAHYLSTVATYLLRAVAPLPLTVSHEYAAGGAATLSAGGAVVAALGAVALRRRDLAVPCALFLAGMLPVAMAAGRLGQAPERYFYLPSLGLAWLLAAGLQALAAWRPAAGRAALAAAALAVAAGAVASVRRLPDWVSDDALFSAALRVDPLDPLGNLHFGVAAGRAGRLEEARRTLERGRERAAGSARIAGALAWVHLRRGDGPAALRESRRAVVARAELPRGAPPPRERPPPGRRPLRGARREHEGALAVAPLPGGPDRPRLRALRGGEGPGLRGRPRRDGARRVALRGRRPGGEGGGGPLAARPRRPPARGWAGFAPDTPAIGESPSWSAPWDPCRGASRSGYRILAESRSWTSRNPTARPLGVHHRDLVDAGPRA